MIYLDFETRSKVDIRKAGAWRYAEDPSTSVLCLAFSIKDGPVQLWIPGEDIPRDLRYYIDYGFRVEAHNAFFERSIWRNIMVKMYGWLDIPDDQWACSASLAAAHAIPRSLEDACITLGLAEKKDPEGRRIMMKMARPRKPTVNDPSIWNTKPEDFHKLYRYCIQDVKAERGIGRALRPLNDLERQVWLLDQKINERGIRVDLEAVEAAIWTARTYVDKWNKHLSMVTGGTVTAATQTARLLTWLQDKGAEIADLTKTTVEEALEAYPNGVISIALQVRQSLSKTSIAKYQAILHGVCQDGRLRDLLMYHGASTGRWTGKLVQPHNMPKNKFKGDLDKYFRLLKKKDLGFLELVHEPVMQTLSQTIRGVFIPGEGKTFYGGDFKGIEARVLLWLAGDEEALQGFRDGKDIYVELARSIYGKEEINEDERALGKVGILGAGYGMGKDKFAVTCNVWGLDCNREDTDKAIDAYRSKYSGVVKLWNNMDSAAKLAVKTGKTIKEGLVSWGCSRGFLFCRLPSGRCLAYYDPKILDLDTPWGETKPTLTYMSVNSVSRKWERTKTFGGKIVENITQAVARDLMAESMLRLEEDGGYEIVLTIHDEIISEHRRGCKMEFKDIMRWTPKWADGLPVEVEEWSGARYLK